MSGLLYREYPPEARIRPFVECFWSTEAHDAIRTGVAPDGCVDIVFSPELGLCAVGVMTTEHVFALSAGTLTTGIRFRPGMARAVLGVSPAEFTDASILLEEIWGRRGKELQEQLSECSTAIGQVRLLDRALEFSRQEVSPVQQAIAETTAAHGTVDLNEVAWQAGLSTRQFRRRCCEETGLTPKCLCRILRFRRAKELAVKSPAIIGWFAIAAEAGYFDQAHLIHDFQEFTGRTPMSVFSNTFPSDAR